MKTRACALASIVLFVAAGALWADGGVTPKPPGNPPGKAPLDPRYIPRPYLPPSGAVVGTGTVDNTPDVSQQDQESLRKRVTGFLDAADKCLLEQNYGGAVTNLNSCRSMLPEGELALRWKQIGTRCEQAGHAMLKQADEYMQKKDYANGTRLLEKVSAWFSGMPSARTAREKLAEAENDPAARAALNEVRAQMLFRGVGALIDGQATSAPAGATSRPVGEDPAKRDAVADMQVILKFNDAHLTELVDTLDRIVATCPSCPTTELCKQYLTALSADAQGGKRLERLRQDRSAQQLLATAQAYAQAGMSDKANELYRQLVAKHPDSAAARRAQLELSLQKK